MSSRYGESRAFVDTGAATPPERTYEYQTWSGTRRTVVASRIEFAPEHVVFKLHGELVLAEKNANCNHLRPTTGSETS